MVAMNKELTDTQRQVMETGKELAEKLGLTEFPCRVTFDDLPLVEGQTALIVSPKGMDIGPVKVSSGQAVRTRYSIFFLNNKRILERRQRCDKDWVPSCGPEIMNSLPADSVIYIS
jgi:hypothetical protein